MQAILGQLAGVAEADFQSNLVKFGKRTKSSTSGSDCNEDVQEDRFNTQTIIEYCLSEPENLLGWLPVEVENRDLANLFISTEMRKPMRRAFPVQVKGLDLGINTPLRNQTPSHHGENKYGCTKTGRLAIKNTVTKSHTARPLTDGGNPSPRSTCVIYIRVSSLRQAFDGRGTEGQLSVCKQVVETKGLDLVHEPIIEVNAKGTDFSRKGLNQLLRIVEEKSVDYVVVAHIDRLGRRTLQTLQLLSILNRGHDTIVITPTAEIDLRTTEGTMLGTTFAMLAELDNRARGFRVQRGRVDGFLNKNWKSTGRKIPYGYKEKIQAQSNRRNNVWLQVSPVEATIVRDVFDYFTNPENKRTYVETITYAQENHTLILSRDQLKRILTNPVYIGKPTVRIELSGGEVIEETVPDKSLKIIEGSTYKMASSRMEEISIKRGKSTKEEVVTEITLIEKYGIAPVLDIVGLPWICSKNNCHSLLRNDGIVNLDEGVTSQDKRKVQRKECKKCGKKQKVATTWDIFRLDNYEQFSQKGT